MDQRASCPLKKATPTPNTQIEHHLTTLRCVRLRDGRAASTHVHFARSPVALRIGWKKRLPVTPLIIPCQRNGRAVFSSRCYRFLRFFLGARPANGPKELSSLSLARS